MSFNDNYNKIKILLDPELKRVEDILCNFNSTSFELNENLKNLLMAPSKRIRPLVSFLYLKANGLDVDEQQINVQVAIELIHNATLIHDDIIDKSELRRNTQTLNSKFDNSLAVVAGDFLLAIALKKLLKLENSKILEIFSAVIENMCVGEISQYFSKYKMPTIEEYIEKSAQKTASLFEASLESSAILSGLNVETAKLFAGNFGIAFQIRDDILNFKVQADKPSSNDFENGIYTAPIIFAQNINNIDMGIEKSLLLLDTYLSKSKKVISEFEDNIYKKALLDILDLLRICN